MSMRIVMSPASVASTLLCRTLFNKSLKTAVSTAAATTTIPSRLLATKSSAAPASPEALGYLALKRAAKEKRRALFAASQERKERLKTRRVPHHLRDEKRREFQRWFIRQKVNDEYMNRKARQAGLDWKIQVAVMLMRDNVVLPDKEDWEVEYENLYTYLAQFGKMYPKELVDLDETAPIAITDEELMKLLPKGYTPAPRETEADATGNVRTTERKLKTNIYLTVLPDVDANTVVEGKAFWQFPMAELKEDETLLQGATRAIAEQVGKDLEFWSVSNAPLSVWMNSFSEDKQAKEGYYGTKTFFMKLYLDEGQVSEEQMTVKDFAWLDREEIVARVKEEQGDHVSKFYHYLL